MELCEGGDLGKLLQTRQSLSEADTKQVMSSLAEAIKYLHQQGVSYLYSLGFRFVFTFYIITS